MGFLKSTLAFVLGVGGLIGPLLLPIGGGIVGAMDSKNNKLEKKLDKIREEYVQTEEFQTQQEKDLKQLQDEHQAQQENGSEDFEIDIDNATLAIDKYAERLEYLQSDEYIDSLLSQNEEYKEQYESLTKGILKNEEVRKKGIIIGVTGGIFFLSDFITFPVITSEYGDY